MTFPPLDSPYYVLTAQALLTGSAALATVGLGLLVLLRERGSRVSLQFFVMTFAAGLWLAAYAWMYCAVDERVAAWWSKIGQIGVLSIPAAVYHFTATVLRIDARRRRWIAAGWVLSGGFVLAMLSTDWLVSGVRPYWWGYYTRYGWLNLPFLAFFFSVLAAILRDYWRAYRCAEPRSPHQRRTRAFLAAFGIAYLASADYLAAYAIPVYPFGYLPVFGFLAVAARTIWRYHLVDITPATTAANIIDTMSDALIVVDDDGIVRLVNQAAVELLGYREGELVGRPASFALDGALSPERLRALLQTGGTLRNRETAYHPKEGGTHTLSLSASVMRDRSAKPLAVVCIARDITDQKEAEAALHEANRRLAELGKLVEHSEDAIIGKTLRGVITTWNRGAERLYGYTAAEAVGRPIALLLPPDRRYELDGIFERLQRGESIEAYETTRLRKDGQIIHVAVTISPVRDHAGAVVGASAIARDITDRKRAEQEIERLASFPEENPDAVVEIDEAGVPTYVNPSARAQFPDVARQGARHPILEGLPALVAALHQSGEPTSLSREVETGGRVYEEWISAVPHSRLLRLYIRDATTRKRAEEALRNYANEVHDLYNKAPCGYHSLDRDGVVVAMNDTELGWLGYAHEEVVGKKRFVDLLAPESVAIFQRSFQALQVRGWLRDLECEMVRRDGTVLSVLLNATAITDEQGRYLAGRSTVFDITGRKALEEQLVQAQKFELIGQLATGIAHEINTPIQYVGSNVGFLQGMFSNLDRLLDGYGRLLASATHGTVPPALLAEVEALVRESDLAYIRQEVPKAVAQSLEGVERVSKIVRSVRELSHPGSPKKTPVDLNHALERTIAMAHSEWRYVAEMVTDLDPALPPTCCLEGAVQQAILNILVNAAQAIAEVVGPDGSKGKGTITVSSRRLGPWAEIRISDTGKGIPRDIRAKVFDPFFTTKEVGRGTGQGLSIAHSIIVRQHNGRIRFDTTEGKGTTFIVRLPIQESEPTLTAKGGEGDVASGVVRG